MGHISSTRSGTEWCDTSTQLVFMVSQYEGWAMGDNATILHYTVSGGVGTWNLVTVSGIPIIIPRRQFDIYLHALPH